MVLTSKDVKILNEIRIKADNNQLDKIIEVFALEKGRRLSLIRKQTEHIINITEKGIKALNSQDGMV